MNEEQKAHIAPTSDSSTLVHVDPTLIEAATQFAKARKSPRTRAAYAREWKRFEAWAQTTGLGTLPAEPQTVALYLAHMARTDRKAAGIDLALVAISQTHRLAGFVSPRTHPLVQEIRGGLRRTLGTAPNRKAPVLTEDLRAMLDVLPEGLAGLRDRALLLMGFTGGFRRSELVALEVADIEETTEGLRIQLRRSKTDQEGAGRTIGLPRGAGVGTCPVRAYRAWIKAGCIEEGPVFRGVDRHRNLASKALTGRSVARLVKRAAKNAGLEEARFAGHSLRSGLATSAARAGVPERVIARQTGHRSMTVLRAYIREGELFEENVAGKLGL